MKIISWNINGIQGILKKTVDGKKQSNFIDENVLANLIKREDPDILCLQEIRCSEDFECNKQLFGCVYKNCSKNKKGYSGTLICSKIMPLSVRMDFNGYIQHEELNSEGRLITLEYKDFYLINVYVPNSKLDFSRLNYRVNVWETNMRAYINFLQLTKKVILVGDLNCIPSSKDLYNPKLNIPGNHYQEKKAFYQLLRETKMIDTFRELHPTLQKYSWFFPYNKGLNKGCRLDYCLVSEAFKSKVELSDVLLDDGSDHCPIVIVLNHDNQKLKISLKK